jgi:hypothetical protein
MAIIKLNSRAIPDDTVIASDIADGSVTTAKLAADAVTNAKLADNAVTTVKVADTVNLGRRNIAINGAMQVAQRGTSFTGVTASGTYPVDRFLFHVGSLGTWTLSQSTDVPTGQGFAKSIKCDVTTVDASPSGTDYARIDHRFEGQDLQAFCKGTSNAKQFALSFYVKSAKTGIHIVELQDADNTRNISKAYTVSSANTWEKKELIIDADTTGAFDNDNAKSLTVAWWLSAGADYKSGTLATSWVSPTNANRVVGQVNLADNTANNFFLTGVQLEVGEQATPFENRSYGEELALCQRYYWQYGTGDPQYTPIGAGVSEGSFSNIVMFYPTKMRAAPSIAYSGIQVFDGSTAAGVTSTRGSYIGLQSLNFQPFHGSLVVGRGIYSSLTGTLSYFSFDSEL